jgi:hypothetical protein
MTYNKMKKLFSFKFFGMVYKVGTWILRIGIMAEQYQIFLFHFSWYQNFFSIDQFSFR